MDELRSPTPDERPLVEAFREIVMGFLAQPRGGEDAVGRRRVRYLMEVPAVQETVARRMFGGDSTLAGYVAPRLGRESDDFEVQVTSGALNGALLGALRHWYVDGCTRPVDELLDEMFEALRRGFGLD